MQSPGVPDKRINQSGAESREECSIIINLALRELKIRGEATGETAIPWAIIYSKIPEIGTYH